MSQWMTLGSRARRSAASTWDGGRRRMESMMHLVPMPVGWRPLFAALLLLGASHMALGTRLAEARITACRTDPIVGLSNGAQIRMTATINDDAGDISSIVYALHGPRGTTVKNVVYTGGIGGLKETVRFASDMPPNAYVTDTLVTTNTPNIAVTAATSVSSVGSSATSGLSGQHLIVHLGG